ncbi:MAG: hypothetical protein LC658_09230 [Bacteroidales bacterium]|nr:hypothetical protein [Bacteroidales bacterium]
MRKLEFTFSDLDITPSEIEEFMGFEPGQSPEPFPELIEQALQLAPEHCKITGAFKIFSEIAVHLQNETIQIENQQFFPGKIVVTQLKDATQLALFVCTAGAGISELSKQKTAEGDEMTAYVLDVIGSVTVDKAAGKLQEKILEEVKQAGFNITDPFSPGYCNWSVAEQHKLFSLLPSQICGITLSDSALMHPIKSVSGITGIGKNCKQMGYQCNWCTDRDCFVGKIKRRNNSKKNL